MNPRLQKITDEIDKLRRKVADYQNRLRDLEKLKTELENADIVAAVRGVDIPPDRLNEFIRAYMEKQQGCAVPDMDAIPGDEPKTDKEDLTLEN